MSETTNTKLDFITRTKEIIDSHYNEFKKEDREVTFLLNCLLGLIVTISESEKLEQTVFKNPIDDSFLSILPNKIGFIDNKKKISIDLIERDTGTFPIGHKNDLKGHSKLFFINKIRNAIAHQHIENINEDKKWIGVKLWNENSEKDFEIIFTISELKSFAIALSNEYLAKYPSN